MTTHEEVNPEPTDGTDDLPLLSRLALSLPVIMRPNGKPYRPRAIKAHAWGNDSTWESRCGAVVLGTNDIERAQPLAEEACLAWYGTPYAIEPEVDWFRQGYEDGEAVWRRDDVRGAAGVMFTASDDPEEDR